MAAPGSKDAVYDEKVVVKVQAFVRGSLCRARVSKMVQVMIDELLAKRAGAAPKATTEKSSETTKPEPKKEESVAKGGEEKKPEEKPKVSPKPLTPVMKKRTWPPPPKEEMTEEKEAEEKEAEEKPKVSPKPLSPVFKKRAWPPAKNAVEDKNDPVVSIKPPEVAAPEKKEEKVEEAKQPEVAKQPSASTTTAKSEAPEEKESEPTKPAPAAPKTNSKFKEFNFVSNATKHVPAGRKELAEQNNRLDEEIQQLLKDIQRIGNPEEPSVEFGVLFDDEQVANYYEALVGTLKAAKKKGLIKYDGQFLLKGMNDNVVISIV